MTMANQKIERLEQQFEYFDKALARLKEALAEPESEFMRDAIVKRFEITFEMAWKTMFRFLTDKGERIAAKAWDVIPVAFESLLIEDAEVWDSMRDWRNDASHEYNMAKATELASLVRLRFKDAFELFHAEMMRRR